MQPPHQWSSQVFPLTSYIPQLFSLTFLQLLPVSFLLQLALSHLLSSSLCLSIRRFPFFSWPLSHFFPIILYVLFTTHFFLRKKYKSEVGRRQCKDIQVILLNTLVFEKVMSPSFSTCLEKSMNITFQQKIYSTIRTMQLTATQPHESLSSAAIYLLLLTLNLTGKCYFM